MNETTTPARRHPVRLWIALGAILALIVGGVAAGAWFRTAGDRAARVDTTQTVLEDRLQALVDAGYPAALVSVTEPDGERHDAAAGDADNTAGDAELRVGSNTKMFVAAVVLQLVDEGLVGLDTPIDTYLPGVVTGDGIDGTAITVRQLLQHRTGLPDDTAEVAEHAFEVRDDYVSPRDLVDRALEKPAVFAPGTEYRYTNTNYLVLGLLIERVTERALWEQIDDRIVTPLDLEHTYLPLPGERSLRGAHPEAFHADTPGELRDITELDPSWAWAAGALVSSTADLNTFMQALLGGELLSAESLAAMQETVPAGDELWPDAAYGLGLERTPLSCGGVAWGHGGDIPGTQTRNAVAPDGTAVSVAVTALPWAIVDPADEEKLLEAYRMVVDVLDATLCD